ncbi:MAG: DNA cytosine methyltransferase, partial [Rhodanobacter sp.]
MFAGAGGLSEGLREAGFTSLYANEISSRYAQTYAANHPATQVDSRDIRKADARKIRNLLGLKRGELDLIAGGPPCQPFSRAGAAKLRSLVASGTRSPEDERVS